MDGDGWDDFVPCENELRAIEMRALQKRQKVAHDTSIQSPGRCSNALQQPLVPSTDQANEKENIGHRYQPLSLQDRRFPDVAKLFTKPSQHCNAQPLSVPQAVIAASGHQNPGHDESNTSHRHRNAQPEINQALHQAPHHAQSHTVQDTRLQGHATFQAARNQLQLQPCNVQNSWRQDHSSYWPADPGPYQGQHQNAQQTLQGSHGSSASDRSTISGSNLHQQTPSLAANAGVYKPSNHAAGVHSAVSVPARLSTGTSSASWENNGGSRPHLDENMQQSSYGQHSYSQTDPAARKESSAQTGSNPQYPLLSNQSNSGQRPNYAAPAKPQQDWPDAEQTYRPHKQPEPVHNQQSFNSKQQQQQSRGSFDQHRYDNGKSSARSTAGNLPRNNDSHEQQSYRSRPAAPSAQGRAQPYGPRLVLSGAVRMSGDGCIDLELPFHNALQQKLSSMGNVRWVANSRVWRTSLQDHESVLNTLQQTPGIDLRIEELHDVPQRVLKAVASWSDESSRFEDIPEKLRGSLMKFQTQGVRSALQRGTRILIGDEMGLGKTVQAIALLAAYKDKWPAVIITPASLREQWADALHQWLGVTERRLMIINSGKDVSMVKHMFEAPGKTSRDFLILSYNFVGKLKDFFESFPFKLVVLDESHCIKDSRAARTKDTVPVVQKAEHAVLLSGTPMINRPKEMLTQLSALVPAAKLKLKDFGERYCLNPTPRFSKYDGCCNQEELNKLLTSTIMVRRLKKDVLDQLPPKRRQQVFLRLDKSEKDKLDAQTSAMAAARSMAEPGSVSPDARRLVMDLYRLTATLKVKAVQQYVEELLDEEQKFLIFCHHKVMNDGIAEVLNKKKVKHICIDGSVEPKKRQGLVENFQLDVRVRVALLSIHAAGVGLTLTAASLVVFAEYAWSPGEIQQAEDRAHRIGQPSSVNIYFLHVKGSIDDIMWGLVQNKLGTVGQAMNGCKESFDLSTAAVQRDSNQGSLRGYLEASQPVDLDDDKPRTTNHAAPPRQPLPNQDHRASNKALSASSKQAKLNSFFQAGAPAPAWSADDNEW